MARLPTVHKADQSTGDHGAQQLQPSVIDLRSSYLVSTGSQSLTVDLRDGDFKFQLERNSFTGTPLNITLAVAAKNNDAKVLASIDWEEIT